MKYYIFTCTIFIVVLGSAVTDERSPAKHEDDELRAQENTGCQDVMNYCKDFCLENIYVMAFTSDLTYAGSSSPHLLEIRANGETKQVPLSGSKGYNTGTMWDFSYSDIGFTRCLYKDEIEGLALVENGGDWWNVGSIVTLLDDSEGNTIVLTKDFYINQWIYDDEMYKRYDLTLVI